MPTSAIARDERVRLNRIRILFGHANGNMASIMMGALLIAIVLYSAGVEVPVLVAWGLFLGAISIWVLLFERRVQRIGLTAENCQGLARTRIWLGAGIALLYGITGFLLPVGPSPAQDTFLFIILSTIGTVGALGYAVMPKYYLALTLFSLLPLTAHFAQQYLVHRDNYHLVLIAVSVLWQVIVLQKASRVSMTAIDAIVLNERLQDEIAEHTHTKEAIRHLALHDELTGLGNRRSFEETVSRTLSMATRDQSRFGLIAIDLDEFKPVNDQHGHAVGDALLKAVATRLLGAIRAADFCARVGGDEFTIIVGSVHADTDVTEVADKLAAVFAEPFVLDQIVVRIGASIGWAMYPEDGTSPAQIMAIADKRMYLEKRAHRSKADAERPDSAPASVMGLA
jgi:diguanylate cyclase (GGDEF)-like protein